MRQERTVSLSLIIPVYNVADYIERCLKSVMKQTYDSFECILVNDASPDDSISRCEHMIAEYSGPISFRIVHHQQNRGLSAARNTGMDAATGDYILFIDSDDLISNDCIEKLLAPVWADNTIEMVVGEQIRFSEKGPFNLSAGTWRHKEDLSSNSAVRDLYFDGKRHLPPAAWNKLTSKEFLVRHQLRFREGLIWEDTLWTFFVMKYLRHLYVIPDVTYYYYYRPDAISYGTAKEEKVRQWCNVFGIISANFTPGDESREARYHFSRFYSNYLLQPQNREVRATARRFSKALPFRKYPKEKTLLTAARILPHNQWGKEILSRIEKRIGWGKA